MTNVWIKQVIDGVECVTYDGYELEMDDLRKRPGFFVAHVAEKAWATPRIVADLRKWAVSDA